MLTWRSIREQQPEGWTSFVSLSPTSQIRAPIKQQTSIENESGCQTGASVPCRRESRITFTRLFFLVLLCSSDSGGTDALFNSSQFLFSCEVSEPILYLQIFRWSRNFLPSTSSHYLPTFIIMGVSTSQTDRHRLYLTLLPSVQLVVWTLEAGECWKRSDQSLSHCLRCCAGC